MFCLGVFVSLLCVCVCVGASMHMCSHVCVCMCKNRKTFLLGVRKQLFLSPAPLVIFILYVFVSPCEVQAILGRKRSWEIPPHGRGLRRTLVARFNGGGHGSKVPPGSTFATLPRSCPGPPSKWAASRTLMCISKTKGRERGGRKMGFDFSEIYGRDEISFE